MDPIRGAEAKRCERVTQRLRCEKTLTDLLVMHRHVLGLQLLQGVRERVVPDVVQETCIGHQLLALPCLRRHTAAISQMAQRDRRKVIDPERMIEARMRGARIDEVRQS